jgi:hypothetical protein
MAKATREDLDVNAIIILKFVVKIEWDVVNIC